MTLQSNKEKILSSNCKFVSAVILFWLKVRVFLQQNFKLKLEKKLKFFKYLWKIWKKTISFHAVIKMQKRELAS